ncbi:virulence-associated E family protein [Butyrivibrio sp. FC2001]|uniref:virulence-associated E family protein n=1 Tax=Butyrivibrio sp. FC2001 TaxID=1280671 RepID=UPI0003F91B61|nr:virulence-associated E family protein [Butyrivibrio sp. FC2001]
MRISVGNSRMDKKWKAKDISWDDFLQKCSTTIRTTETVDEYRKLSKAKQDDIKDVGGFVAGHLKNGRRKNGCVEARSMLTLDLDHAVKDIWDEVTMFFDFKCLMYSTHKHTPDEPRVRLIIPLSREVSADEYTPISRMIASDIGMDMVDDTCYEPARLMYWPSTSADGDFLFESQNGPLLNPDMVLARYKDWRDTTEWPMSSRQSEIVKRSIAKQADPLEKKGPLGAFCRAYTIQEAFDTFIPDIYKPAAMEGRYDYVPADSAAGVVIYDDKFAYSHHATDPCCGQLLNAFDAIRLHKFGGLDDKAKLDTAPSKLPSYKAMVDLVLSDDKVKMQLAKERMASADEDFDPEDENWVTKLELDKEGNPKATLTNFAIILKCDPRLQEICYNAHRCGIDIRGTEYLPWEPLKGGWSDNDMAALQAYFDRTYHMFSATKLKPALLSITQERAYHPIREYLEKLPAWDGIKRVENLLIDYLGATDTPYTKAIMVKTLVAAVARVYEPGTKFDYVLVLSGPQGIGKSTFFSKLGGRWFSDSLSIADMRDKTGPEKLQGFWILEISEMAGLKKVDVETVKSFASRQDDKYRVAYGSVVESHPRQCIMVGTTNAANGFLRDITGNRRFWPCNVTGECDKHPWEMKKETIDQIWAEALHLYNEGEELTLKGDEAMQAYEEQKEAMEQDDREGLVQKFLEMPLPKNWYSRSTSERRMYFNDDEFESLDENDTIQREKVCNMEIWTECYGKDPASIKKSDSYEIQSIMNKMSNWKRYEGNKNGKLSFQGYGSQVAYVREGGAEDKE